MTQQHPITPPPELVKAWLRERDDNEPMYLQVAAKAAQWGADQELEACCEWMDAHSYFSASIRIREDRRPKPPSLKEQALEQLDGIRAAFQASHGGELVCDSIRRALEQLPDHE